MTGAFSVRQAIESDIVAIGEVHNSAIRARCKDHYSPGQIRAWTAPCEPGRIARSLAEDLFIVAESGGEVVGFGQLNQKRGEVIAVYVAPSHDGRGIGAALLDKLLIAARHAGLEEVTLHSSLNAKGFYLKMGFEAVEEMVHTLGDGTGIECVLMRKSLAGDS